MKISKTARKDFNFFLTTDLDLIGTKVGIEESCDDPAGGSALECWYSLDTHGVRLPCRETEAFQKAGRGKASWNLQVKLWAEAMVDPVGLVLQQEELVDYCHGLPGWIFEATVLQAGKLFCEREGWTPRFLRLEKLKGNWWPPYMDSFDPTI